MTHEAAETGGQEPVPPYARIEVIGGVAMVAIAALIWFGAINLAVGKLPNFGPGALPRALAVLLALAGAGVFVQGLVRPEAAFERFDFALRPVLIILLAVVLFGLFIKGGNFGLLSTPQLGLCIVGPLTVFIAGSAAPQVNLKELLVLSFGLTALMLLVFPDLLRLSIPPFPPALQNAIPPALGRETAIRIACAGYGAIALALFLVLVRREGRAA
jgi:hypothetical protein